MADAASKTPPPRSSSRASSVSGSSATWVVGIRHATTVPTAKTMVARPSTHSEPPDGDQDAAGHRRRRTRRSRR